MTQQEMLENAYLLVNMNEKIKQLQQENTELKGVVPGKEQSAEATEANPEEKAGAKGKKAKK